MPMQSEVDGLGRWAWAMTIEMRVGRRSIEGRWAWSVGDGRPTAERRAGSE
jgi:hypothetical protein